MRVKHLYVTITILFSLLLPNYPQAQAQRTEVVSIPDTNLAAAIRQEIGDSITMDTLLNLTRLEASNRGIKDLTGLEHAHNLEVLDLGSEFIQGEGFVNSNTISDLSPLVGLGKLTYLNLTGSGISDLSLLAGLTQLTMLSLNLNNISDLSPLAGLAQLTSLNFSSDEISDLSPLSGLTQLRSLGISGTSISDISPLSGLTQLVYLTLWNTSISDISALSGLTQIDYLELTSNEIWDVSPLSGLTQLKHLNIVGNPLSYASLNTHIPAMQAKGVEVEFNARVPTTLVKISGAAQEGLVNTTLQFPFVVEVLDQEGRAFAEVPVRFAVTMGGGKLHAKSVNTDAMGRASAHLTFGQTGGTTTVRATATGISQPVEFTVMAILHSSPVAIPDANLRMKIMETLRKPFDEILTVSDMLKLTTLIANDANIYDLTGLQHAADLTTLSLNNNYITVVSPLAALTQLTKLSLNNNKIWDLEPLIGLTELTTLSLESNSISDIKPLTFLPQLKTLHLRGNWLANSAFIRHIPAMQMKGIDIRFDPQTQDSRPVVRLIYFLPHDRDPQPYIDERFDRFIKSAQQLYGDQLEAHGLDRKTFLFEADESGKAIVHRVIGKFTDEHYSNSSTPWEVWEEIDQRFDTSKNFYVTVIDNMRGILAPDLLGLGGSQGDSGGKALVHVNHMFPIGHELGHAFGLSHDNRNNAKRIFLHTHDSMLNSFCAAEWLAQHRAFNPGGTPVNRNTTIKMLPLDLASPSYPIRLRFEVTDPDGIHQVQIYASADGTLDDYKGLNGNPSSTVEFAAGLTPETPLVTLGVMDVYGNITSQGFPIEVVPLLPPLEVVSVPDANLAAAVKQEIGASITTHTMLNLTSLWALNRQITDLTGLEHAHNLWVLNLGADSIPGNRGLVNSNAVSDFSPLEGLTRLAQLSLLKTPISDASALSKLTQLRVLVLDSTGISDVAPLANLIQLERLILGGNPGISDIAPLANLTQLIALYIGHTGISDVTPLTNLTELLELDLNNTGISGDVAPLANLTQLSFLNLSGNLITDIAFLANLTRLTHLHLSITGITDIAPLTNLTKMILLDLSGNRISDITPLTNLTQTEFLYLHSTGISDVAPLTNLTQLILLNLSGNRISDVAPLTNLKQLNLLDLTGNLLSYASINTHIPAIQAKEVEVRFDSRTPTRLVKISGASQEGAVNIALPLPFVVEVRDEQNQAFAGVPVTFTVTSGGSKLSATTVSTDGAGRASAHLTLGRTAGTSTVRVAVSEISQPVEFTATAIPLSTPVTIPDVNLRGKIIEALDKPRGGTLTRADMLKLIALVAINANIRDLTGLEYAPNLKVLLLNDNNLSDMSLPGAFTHLTVLSLNGNNISDVSPLGVLTGLETLLLDDNNLSDVTPLAGLRQLKTLSLNNNNISNVVPLEVLPRLKILQLRGNPLSYPSLYTSVPAIQANGTTVTVDLRSPTTLVKVSGTHGVAGASLPFIVEVQDGEGFRFSGVPVTFTVVAGGGYLYPSNVITDSTGRASITLTLGANPGKNTVSVTAAEVQHPTLFTITAINANSPVTILDANLRAKIAETLDKPVGVQLTAGDMLTLTELNAPNADIHHLTGLEYAHNLRVLNLGGEYIEDEGTVNSNTISDFSPIAGLTELNELDLSFGSVSDVSFLSGLTQLRTLRLSNNPLSDISALSGLTQLTFLELSSTATTDVSPLRELTQLTRLYLFNTSISDVSALSRLTELIELSISGTTVSDVSPLAGLTRLTHLYLVANAISDISVLSGLTQLYILHLSVNEISDISPLSDLTQLAVLALGNNAISDVSPLIGLKLPGARWNGTGLYIQNNPLNYASVHTHIPAMQAKGVEVRFDNRAHSALVKISGNTQEAEAGTTLANPFVVEALDEHGVPIIGLSVTFDVIKGDGRLSPTTTTTDTEGRAQTTLTLGRNPGVNKIRVTAAEITYPVTFTAIATEASHPAVDVNRDGMVNIQDLVLVSTSFGQTGANAADVNGDGVVNISDLVLVAGAFGEGAAAVAPTLQASDLEGFTTEKVQDLLTQARQLALTDPAYLRGIAVLEQLLARLLPKETALLPNYPNPFNPETWIPYQLAKPADVTLTIYDINGNVVRALNLGYQRAGMYHSRIRAAHWNGKNSLGESVASGVYFYTLTAGDFTATRKMLILK